jgi:hypothetical protein
MFALKFVGELFEMPHCREERDSQSDQVLSPGTVLMFNFFSRRRRIIQRLSETSETISLMKHHGYVGNFYKKRTSDNAWDTHGKTAIRTSGKSNQNLVRIFVRT